MLTLDGTAGRAPAPVIPARITDDAGRVWTITRAWPGTDGAVTFEASSRQSPHVRGGRISAADGAVLAPVGSDRGLPELAGLAATGTVVVHRPGRRAVVRTHDGSRYIKVVRPGRAESILNAAGRADAFARGLGVAEILDRTPDSVHFAALPGRTLHDLGSDVTVGAAAWTGLWDHWATAWTTVIGQTAAHMIAPERAHPAHAEIDVVHTWATHAQRLTASPGEAIVLAQTAERVTALLAHGMADGLVASHRDLHDKQLLWHDGAGLRLLDLDTATRAEAALDLGNFAAHVALRHRQGLWSAAKTRTAQGVVREVAATLAVSPERLHAYETAARFRITCVYAYRPAWAALARRLHGELRDELGPGVGGHRG